MSAEKTEQTVSVWYRVQKLSKGGDVRRGQTVDFPDEPSARAFAESKAHEYPSRVERITQQTTLVELQRYA